MATLESVETKLDELALAFAKMQGQLEGKVHEFPCPALVGAIRELKDDHVRPLEDWRQRLSGIIIAVAALGGTGTFLAGLDWVLKLLRKE